jgi:putative phage-type endonuclease
MDRIDHNLEQGSESWLQFRLEHFGASEAAAAMGISPYMTRTDLLALKKTGIAKEVSANTQAVFDKGHQVEALARPIVEALIGADLYPVTVSRGKLSASCDGLTMDDSIGFECKQFNKSLFESVNNGAVPDHHMPQIQQCLYVTGADKWIFTVSDGTEANTRTVDVYPDPEYIDEILKAWAQFEKDLADFVPVAHVEKPVAEPIKALPALAIQIKGEVSVSNLPRFKEAADVFVATIKTDLQTDQDFADAESNVKFLDEAEKSLEHAKKAALSQTADIDELMRTIDQIKDSMRTKRLALDKLVKSKKEEIKSGIVLAAQQKLAAHLKELSDEIKPVVLSIICRFTEAVKGKRSISSLHDAVDTELSRCKIEADSLAANIRKNLALLDKQAPTQKALFADLATLALQPFETFSAIVENRLAAELARVAKIEAEAKARAEAEAAHQAENAKIRAAAAAMLAMNAQAAPVEPTIVLTPKAVSVPLAPTVTDKYAGKKTPTLRELASAIAFEYAVDARTATAWIVSAVNHYQNQSEAA